MNALANRLCRIGGFLPIAPCWRISRHDDPAAWVIERFTTGWKAYGSHGSRRTLIQEIARRMACDQIVLDVEARAALEALPDHPSAPLPIGPTERWLRDNGVIVDRKPIAITGSPFAELTVSIPEAVRRLNAFASLGRRVDRHRVAGALTAAGIHVRS